MQKILSLTIALSLILSVMMQCNIYAVSDTEEYLPYTISANFLKSLGIADETEYDFSTTLSRETAAVYIERMLENHGIYGDYRGVFSDMSRNDENVLIIENLANLGIVSGYTDRSFRPDSFITYDEAITMLVNVWGYGNIKDSGVSYYEIALRYGLIDNIKRESSFVSVGDLFVMIYNALHGNVIQMQTSKGSYTLSEETLLYINFDIVYSEGVIVKNDLTYLWSSQDVRDNCIQIQTVNGSIVEIEVSDSQAVHSDLGKLVRVYYTEEDNEYVFHEIKSKNNVKKINLSDVDLTKTDISNHEISYFEEDGTRTKTLRLSENHYLIYNNMVYKSHTVDMSSLENKTGMIECIDSDADDKYDVIKIKVYETLVAGNVSEIYEVINDKFNPEKKVDLSEDSYIKIKMFNGNGEKISIDSISEGNVISYAVSDTLKAINTIEVYVSDVFENGEVTQIDNSKIRAQMTVDYKKTFTLADRAAITPPSAGCNVVYYIDAFGFVVYTEPDYARNTQYGLMIKPFYNEEEDVAEVTYLNMEKKYVKTKVSQNVIIDGVRYKKKSQEVYLALMNANSGTNSIAVAQGVYIMRYRLNENGELQVIDTPCKGSGSENDTLECMGSGTFGVNGGYILGYTLPYKSDTHLMSITLSDYTKAEDYKKEKNVSISTAGATFKTGQAYSGVIAYRSHPESSYADFILRLRKTTISHDTTLFVIDKIQEVYDETLGETVLAVKGYDGSTERLAYIDINDSAVVNLKNYKRGDVIRASIDGLGYINSYENVLRNNADGSITTSNISGNGIASTSVHSVTIINGYIYEKEDNLVKTNMMQIGSVLTNPQGIDWKNEDIKVAAIEEASTAIIVVDSEEKCVRLGSIEDIKDYKNYKTDCSRVLMRLRSGRLRELVVYK